MTTTEMNTQPRHCRRCHGTGREPAGPAYTAKQEAVLDRLAELGAERKKITDSKAYTQTAGRLQLDKIYREIRKVLPRGERLGIRTLDMIDALGVTSAAFYKRSGPYQADH